MNHIISRDRFSKVKTLKTLEKHNYYNIAYYVLDIIV